MSAEGGAVESKGIESGRLRVLSYNIHHAAGMDGKVNIERIARVIRSAKPEAQIDCVLCRPAAGWKVVSVNVLDEAAASDHRPILVVLDRISGGKTARETSAESGNSAGS